MEVYPSTPAERGVGILWRDTETCVCQDTHVFLENSVGTTTGATFRGGLWAILCCRARVLQAFSLGFVPVIAFYPFPHPSRLQIRVLQRFFDDAFVSGYTVGNEVLGTSAVRPRRVSVCISARCRVVEFGVSKFACAGVSENI